MQTEDITSLESLLGETGPEHIPGDGRIVLPAPLISQAERERKREKRRAFKQRMKAAREKRSASDKEVDAIEKSRKAILERIKCVRSTMNDADFAARQIEHCEGNIRRELAKIAEIRDWQEHGFDIIERLQKTAAEMQTRMFRMKHKRDEEKFNSTMRALDPDLFKALFMANTKPVTRNANTDATAVS